MHSLGQTWNTVLLFGIKVVMSKFEY